MKRTLLFCALLAAAVLPAAAGPSALDKASFAKHWRIESEAADYRLSFRGDTADITAPKGLTLWRKEKMAGRTVIEYDACISKDARVSDLNCFFMASDPQAPADIFKRAAWRGGVFNRCYSLQLYYLGYGGNNNTTTRFRRYTGDAAGVDDAARRPAILKEYTDAAHLLRGGHWYHVRLTAEHGHIACYIDGERIVDFRDAAPLCEGWFGLRTTLAHISITNFRYTCEPWQPASVPLHWVGAVPALPKAATFGVPFDEGAVQPGTRVALRAAAGAAEEVAADTWPLAKWPDGSVKWLGVAAVMPANSPAPVLQIAAKGQGQKAKGKGKNAAAAPGARRALSVSDAATGIRVSTGAVEAFFSKQGTAVLDSLRVDGRTVATRARLVAATASTPDPAAADIRHTTYATRINSATVERAGSVRATVRVEGVCCAAGREWLPFTLRFYFYAGSRQVRVVHSFIFDGDADTDFISAYGLAMDVPMREAAYNRHVAFSCADGGVWSEPVQPLVGRRVLALPGQTAKDTLLQERQMLGQRIPAYEAFDEKNRKLIDNWAAWDGYRLSQLSPDAFTLRKRAEAARPWIGTFSGTRAGGYAFAGDITGGLGMAMQDFWQSFPSTLAVDNARSGAATLTAWMWSPEAEPMDLRHYDSRAHDLNAAYEDVQPGMSTPTGVARTTTFTLLPSAGYSGKADFAADAALLAQTAVVLPEPQYLHDREAFGVWSMPDTTNQERRRVEERLTQYADFYAHAQEENKWYGFWNYGDLMHAYDPVRHTWRYDIGGYAWDNTELASNMMIWYNFLRTGRADLWRMAEAITRHTSEVDVYHTGPNAGLGSRHNVSHWGCGAKEGRISQAAWNRFYYYLTADERVGDLMTAVRDADQKLYTLDPMRLAEPRSMYPCTAPARLRIGPDWISYAGNWMTEWERTGNTHYRDKIITGMKSIAGLPSQIFTGPLALGYDPATGIITSECDPKLQSTNHLMPIMGGFEMMNEMLRMIHVPEWDAAWLDHAARYKPMSLKITHNRFRISRLMGYAAWHNHDQAMAAEAWNDLFTKLEHTPAPPTRFTTVLPPAVPAPLLECSPISTNDAAIWTLDAIFMQEVVPQGN